MARICWRTGFPLSGAPMRQLVVAEGVGFEPTETRRPQRLSRPSHSSALAAFRPAGYRRPPKPSTTDSPRPTGDLRAERLVRRSQQLDQIGLDDVVDTLIDAVSRVLIGFDDHEPPVFQRVGHRPAAVERRARIAGGTDHHDRPRADSGDLEARI